MGKWEERSGERGAITSVEGSYVTICVVPSSAMQTQKSVDGNFIFALECLFFMTEKNSKDPDLFLNSMGLRELLSAWWGQCVLSQHHKGVTCSRRRVTVSCRHRDDCLPAPPQLPQLQTLRDSAHLQAAPSWEVGSGSTFRSRNSMVSSTPHETWFPDTERSLACPSTHLLLLSFSMLPGSQL